MPALPNPPSRSAVAGPPPADDAVDGAGRFLSPTGRREDILRELMLLRTVAIVGQTIALGLAWLLGAAVPYRWAVATVIVVAVFNLVELLGARRRRRHGRYAVAGHLALDLGAFTLLIVLTGGLANPFAVLFMLHASLVSLVLPFRQAVVGCAAVIAAIAASWAAYAPLQQFDGTPIAGGHALGGLLSAFALAALITAWFGARVVRVVRSQDRLLHEAARQASTAETLLRLGAVAAGAAHELAGPLSTIAVIAGEMRRNARTPEDKRDAEILSGQVSACRRIIDDFRDAAGHATGEAGAVPLDEFLHGALSTVKATRPNASIRSQFHGERPVPTIGVNPSLKQTLLILLNNAADASPHDVELEARWDAEVLTVAVSDSGSGFAESSLEKLGRTFFTTKSRGKGMGLGLVLAASAVARLGGTICWSNRAEGGARAEVVLPLTQLTINPGG